MYKCVLTCVRVRAYTDTSACVIGLWVNIFVRMYECACVYIKHVSTSLFAYVFYVSMYESVCCLCLRICSFACE